MVLKKRILSKASLFDSLEEKISYLGSRHRKVVFQAYKLASAAHKSQKRKTGEPYITHPIAVACILADLRMDYQTLVAGLLHDTIEDTELTKKDIESKFDIEVAVLVDGVSKLEHINFNSRLEAQAEYLRKMLLAMSKDIRVIIVKLADRLHNMRTINAMSVNKRRLIAKETLDIYAQIARRLGMSDICLELENLSFQTLYPTRYAVLESALKKSQGQRQDYLQAIIKDIKKNFIKHRFSILSLDAREKHLFSIYKKMKKKNISFFEVNDVFGVRVVVDSTEDCYLALCYIHEIFKPIFGKFKDYIAMPKPNGYKSIHTVLFGHNGSPIEVQIRSKQMSLHTQVGLCSHWAYKTKKRHVSALELDAQQWVKSLIESQKQTGNSVDFLENVKVNLVPNEVYVFTPKGEIVELPVGATIVDMAYAIHTEIGHTCVAAKVDRQLMPLSAILHSGETVEIITSPTSSPKLSYLDFVITPKAKHNIRSYFRNKKKDQAFILGSKLLESTLKSDIVELGETKMQAVSKRFGHDGSRELLINIGLGYQHAKEVADYIKLTTDLESCISANDENALPISGAEGMVLTYSSCCYPIPGDPIFGYLVKDKGVLLHHQSCSNNNHCQQFKEVPVYWSGMVVGNFKVSITIYAENEQGLLAKIALAIADQHSSIEDIKIIPSSSSSIDINLLILVSNRKHLSNIFKKLRLIKNIYRVKRNYREI